MKLGDIKERNAIDMIWEIYGKKEEYDDCAIVENGKDYLLFTTDFVGEGTHFLPSSDPTLVGKFMVDVNLSDIAAMGGVPDYFMASMFFPANKEEEYVGKIIKGLKNELGRFGVRYLGGDLKESKITGFSGFAIGHVNREKILRRKGSKKGEKIYLTGPLGEKGALYVLWKDGRAEFDEILKIEPRVEEGLKLSGNASACMDTSDGLFSVLREMQNANNLGFNVNIEDIPIHKIALEVAEDYKIKIEDLLRFGGEYELVYTASERILGYEIGEVVEEKIDYGGKGYESFGKALD